MIKKILFTGLMAISSLSAVADEGMWVLHNIDARTQRTMQQLGLQLSGQELYDPESGVSLKDAVVDFGDFCSGVVVSADGLVFTNHHCGFSAIQSLSSVEDDILTNGFVAHNHAEERPAEGLSVYFLERTEDITERVKAAVEAAKVERSKKKKGEEVEPLSVDKLTEITEVVLANIDDEYSQAYLDRVVRTQSFCGGSQFFVSIYKEYKDVRLVFTPTRSLGKFGGDTDNWMWPRQTCDFSVFRIYADKDGNPAEYSTENVPLHPKRWAQVSMDGYAPGDYCMTIGFPGSTSRYLSSYGITERIEQRNKPTIEVRGAKQDVWKKWMKSDPAINLKYATKFAHSSNYWKNSIGMNKALDELGIVAEKEKMEESITNWINGGDEERQARFGNMLSNLKEGYAKRSDMIRNLMYLREMGDGVELYNIAELADRLSLCDDSASTAYSIRRFEEYMKDYDVRVDEETTTVLFNMMAEKVDTAYLPEFCETVKNDFNGDYKAYVHHLFSETKLTRPDALTYIIMAGKSLKDDPAMQMAEQGGMAYYALAMEYGETMKQIEYNEDLLTQAFMEMEMDQPHYSDANFSMRLSYGIIQDYTAGSQHYNYFTNAQSLLDKAAMQNENDDYMLEDGIVGLLKKGDFGRYADKNTGEMQLCFLSNNDITGGNSGSPMFNGKGELIGLAFDGNWEAMSGDISFNPALQRCIGVDIRFVLYIMDKWGHADNLIEELRLK